MRATLTKSHAQDPNYSIVRNQSALQYRFGHVRTKPFVSPMKIDGLVAIDFQSSMAQHTAQAPATDATNPPDIIIGFNPRVLLNSMPLSAPATILFVESCFPR